MTEAGKGDAPVFISLEEAAALKNGTRITFIPGVQALYAEALKNICFVKGIPVIRALHPMMGVDKETGEALLIRPDRLVFGHTDADVSLDALFTHLAELLGCSR